ncbi:MAG: DUF3347 domain-containing protein [Terrimonas sp.]|nr:DUF3347 domain-containing protein [Terrimonas sp.]
MKVTILSIALAAFSLGACNNSQTSTAKTDQHPDSSAVTTEGTSVRDITDVYLQLKNALAEDNGNDAAGAAKKMVEAIGKINQSAFTSDQKKLYADIEPDLKENAEHISENSDKLEHQREHFVMLSNDVADLIKGFGTGGQILYKDFCPMANDNKGAIWISEVKEIKNPYMGKSSPTCGSMKEELK